MPDAVAASPVRDGGQWVGTGEAPAPPFDEEAHL